MNETIIDKNANENVVEEVKPYTFRKLSSDDMFLMFEIIKKIGLKEFKKCFEGESLKPLLETIKGGDEQAKKQAVTAIGVSVGFEAVDVILGNLPKCKGEIYELLSSVSGMSIDEIKADALLFTEMVIDFFKKPEFPGFFKVVSKLFK